MELKEINKRIEWLKWALFQECYQKDKVLLNLYLETLEELKTYKVNEQE